MSAISLAAGRFRHGDVEAATTLRTCLESGINLIDTSATVNDGSNQVLVGHVLSNLQGAGLPPRDQVAISVRLGLLGQQGIKRFSSLVPKDSMVCRVFELLSSQLSML